MTQNKIDFTIYSTEKLVCWIKLFTLCPATHLLYSEEIYQEALNELNKRIDNINKIEL